MLDDVTHVAGNPTFLGMAKSIMQEGWRTPQWGLLFPGNTTSSNLMVEEVRHVQLILISYP